MASIRAERYVRYLRDPEVKTKQEAALRAGYSATVAKRPSDIERNCNSSGLNEENRLNSRIHSQSD